MNTKKYYSGKDKTTRNKIYNITKEQIIIFTGLEIKQVQVSYNGGEYFSLIEYVDHNLNQVNGMFKLTSQLLFTLTFTMYSIYL